MAESNPATEEKEFHGCLEPDEERADNRTESSPAVKPNLVYAVELVDGEGNTAIGAAVFNRAGVLHCRLSGDGLAGSGSWIGLRLGKVMRRLTNEDGITVRDPVFAQKFFLRQSIYLRWDQLNPSEYDRLSVAAFKAVKRHPFFQYAKTVLAYAPDRRELDCVKALTESAPEKTWGFPRIEDGVMNFFVDHYDRLCPGPLGVRESLSTERIIPDDRTLVLCPGVAFTPTEQRLGRGGGYYDAFLTRRRKIISLAVAPRFCYAQTLPVDGADCRVTGVIFV